MMKREYEVWRQSRTGSQLGECLSFGGECRKVVE